MLFFTGRGPFLAPLVEGHAEAPRAHYGARSSPGRSPWRALWTSKVARADFFSRGYVPPRQISQDLGKTTIPIFFLSAAVFACYICITPSLKLYFAAAQQQSRIKIFHLPFMTATDGAFVCVRVYVTFPVVLQ